MRNPISIAAGYIGGPTISRAPELDEIRARRIESARRCPAWNELEAADLVPAGRYFLVSETTGQRFTRYAGAVWNPLGSIAFSELNPLYFYVDQDGDVRLLERSGAR